MKRRIVNIRDSLYEQIEEKRAERGDSNMMSTICFLIEEGLRTDATTTALSRINEDLRDGLFRLDRKLTRQRTLLSELQDDVWLGFQRMENIDDADPLRGHEGVSEIAEPAAKPRVRNEQNGDDE